MGTWWEQVVSGLVSATAVLAVIALLGKAAVDKIAAALGDRYKSLLRADEVRLDASVKAAISFKEKQLSEFYWPLYIRLQKDGAI